MPENDRVSYSNRIAEPSTSTISLSTSTISREVLVALVEKCVSDFESSGSRQGFRNGGISETLGGVPVDYCKIAAQGLSVLWNRSHQMADSA